MADLTFRREETEEILDFAVLVTKFENGAEQRRLVHDRPLIGFKIKLPPNNYERAKAVRDYFLSKQGALSSFTFTNPHDHEDYTVRFEVGSYRSSLKGGAYDIEFDLVRVL